MLQRIITASIVRIFSTKTGKLEGIIAQQDGTNKPLNTANSEQLKSNKDTMAGLVISTIPYYIAMILLYIVDIRQRSQHVDVVFMYD